METSFSSLLAYSVTLTVCAYLNPRTPAHFFLRNTRPNHKPSDLPHCPLNLLPILLIVLACPNLGRPVQYRAPVPSGFEQQLKGLARCLKAPAGYAGPWGIGLKPMVRPSAAAFSVVRGERCENSAPSRLSTGAAPARS